MPAGAVHCARPGPLGNPFHWRDHGAGLAVEFFRAWLDDELADSALDLMPEVWARDRQRLLDRIPVLRGHDLACWCALCDRHRDGRPVDEPCADCAPCHADVLLERANRRPGHDPGAPETRR